LSIAGELTSLLSTAASNSASPWQIELLPFI
jgi:hypothetical protein